MSESDGDPRGHPAPDEPPEPHPVPEQARLHPARHRPPQVAEGPGRFGQQPHGGSGGDQPAAGADDPERQLQQPGASAGGAQPMLQTLHHQRLQEPPHRLPPGPLLRGPGPAQHPGGF